MAGVRCPKCGAMNPDGQRRTARCRGCREELGKCRYCRFYDARQVDCMHEARREMDHVVDADDVANCPDFSSALAPLTPRSLPVILLTAFFIAHCGRLHVAGGAARGAGTRAPCR